MCLELFRTLADPLLIQVNVDDNTNLSDKL